MDRDWIRHKRAGDSEHIGWIEPAGEGFVAIDLLGRRRTEIVDWAIAEETLDEIGLRYLAEPHELRLDDGSWLRVRIAEVSPEEIRVKKDDWGDINATQVYYVVPFPATADRLRQLTP